MKGGAVYFLHGDGAEIKIRIVFVRIHPVAGGDVLQCSGSVGGQNFLNSLIGKVDSGDKLCTAGLHQGTDQQIPYSGSGAVKDHGQRSHQQREAANQQGAQAQKKSGCHPSGFSEQFLCPHHKEPSCDYIRLLLLLALILLGKLHFQPLLAGD